MSCNADFDPPPDICLPEACRNLRPGMLVAIDRNRRPASGNLVLAQIAPGAGEVTVHRHDGRAARLYPGDLLMVVTTRYHAPLALSCELPTALGPAALVSPAGIAGVPLQEADAGRLRLLGVALDADGRALSLPSLVPVPASLQRPLNSVAVISVARGARSAQVSAAVIHGFSRMGLATGVAKPFGMVDARERWSFLDAGAQLALDPVDGLSLDAASLSADQNLLQLRRAQGSLRDAGCQVGVLRIAGGLAVLEVAGLLAHPGFAEEVDGVILAAADAMSAAEGVRRARELGLPLMAVSGALTRSPLAMREAREAIDVEVVPSADLARPATLQRLLSRALQPVASPAAPTLALAA